MLYLHRYYLRRSRSLCYRPSVSLLSVTFVHPTQAIEIFGNVSTPFGTLATYDLSMFPSYLSEFQWRYSHKAYVYGQYLCLLSENYGI